MIRAVPNISKEEYELIERSKKGDSDSFKRLYELYLKRVFHICLKMLGDERLAMETTQDVFVKIYKSLKGFNAESNLNTWIYRICMNHCLDVLKMKKRNRLVSLEDIENVPGLEVEKTPEEIHIKIQRSEIIKSAIEKLKPKIRETVVLRYLDELSYSEIAEIIGCSMGTVSSRLNTGNQILKKELALLFRE